VSTIPWGAPGYTISLQFGISRETLAQVIGSGALASLSPCTIRVGHAIFRTSSRRSADEIVFRQAEATGSGALNIMFLIQVQVCRGYAEREERFFVFGNPGGKISRSGFVLRLDQIPRYSFGIIGSSSE
jgi:hypothetical protein